MSQISEFERNPSKELVVPQTIGRRRRPSQGPDTLRVLFAILVIIVLAGLLAGALGFSMRESM